MNYNVTVVDYGYGNLLSVSRGLEQVGGKVEVTGDPDRLAKAERLVFPGVGAFGKVMQAIHEGGLKDAIKQFAETERPFLGICVGMQAMLDYGEEISRNDGLGIISGHVSAIPETTANGTLHPVPHIGWSRLIRGNIDWTNTILKDQSEDNFVYFVHSFQALPTDSTHVLATCDYNGRIITAAIHKNNVIGCQFHPEKSGLVGLQILKNFVCY